MSAGGGYNDWESDLSSIIEKTNQNLKLLRRIGDKRSDLAYDVSTTATRPATATSAAQIASDMRSFASSISSRYAAEDGGASSSARARGMSTTGIPRATSASASSSSKKLHRSSSMGVENARERARESLIIRPTTAFGSDGEGDGEDRSPRRSVTRQATTTGSGSATRSSTLKRSSSVATGKPRSGSTSSTRTSATASGSAMGGSNNNGSPLGNEPALDELRKSLEVHVASRSSAFEKALGDLRTDMTVVTTETNALSMKMHELRDAVTAKLSNIASATQAVSENGESIGRLEKHSAVLLGWKVGVDQDLFEISTKLKSFASIQEKMASLESHLEALGTAIKNAHRAARYDEKIDEIKDRLALMERQAAHQVDAKAVDHTVQMRVSKEINELENRIQQSLQFLTQKLENKLQALEKSVCSDRIDAIASLKSELLEDIDKLDSKTLKKPEIVPLQNTQTQLKDDIAHMQMFFERQDKRFTELKQNSTQIRDELVETRHELTKALHAQQNRVSTTLEEKVAQLVVVSEDKNVKAGQKMALLEKRHKKIEDQTKALYDAVDKLKHDAVSRRAVDSVAQQRENEKLRQRLAKSIAELEQLHAAKHELEMSMETQERQYQAKVKDLKAQVEEQEKTKETQRTELLQAIQNESKQMGYSQGRNALLESLLAREKQENEEKSQQIHKARQEIAQIRQKMRSLESDVDRKMQKLSTELQAKQSQVDTLVKKLKRSEEDAQKLIEAAKREKKSLARTKELKQQELTVTKMKLKEMEKIITTVAVAKEAEASVTQQHVDHTAALADMESKRKQLELLLTERRLEVQEMQSELKEAKLERDELVNKHQEALNAKIQELTAEYIDQIQSLERGIAAKDAEMKQLREDLVDRSELLELDDALAQLRSEKESLVEQLEAAQVDHERRIVETEASLRAIHREEMDKLRSKTEERVAEITALEKTLAETRERLAALEATTKQNESTHAQEVGRLAQELKEARAEVERLVEELAELQAEKQRIEDKLVEVQAALEAASADDDERQDEVDRLRLSCEELGAERQRLAGELQAKSEELAELKKLDDHHRERLADVMKEQDESRTQLKQEIDSLRETLERERAASAQCEQELKATIETLEEELHAERKQVQEGASGSSKLQIELQSVLLQLTTATQAEAAMRSKLDAILEELSVMASVSVGETATDPASLLRKHVGSMTEKHARDLAALAAEHEDAVKRAAADRLRVQELEKHIQELTTQVEELEDANRELKGDLERLCAEKAKQLLEMGRLQDEISEIRDQKHALEDQVEQQLAQYEELDATLRSQIQEKDAEVEELKEANAGLEKTISDIHETMEQIEANKMNELDGLSTELQELELQLTALTSGNASKASSANEAAMEKEYFANQQAIASAGQQIRALYAKLCSGCSVLELQDLKASLAAVEAKHERYREESQRNRQECVEAEEQVLLNVEFLEALMADSEGRQNSLAAKYVKTAPSLAAKLSQLQEMFHEALQQCSLEAAASLAKENLSRGDGGPECGDEVSNEQDDDDHGDEQLDAGDEEEVDEIDQGDELEASAEELNESTSELEVSHANSAAEGELDDVDEDEDADFGKRHDDEEEPSPHSSASSHTRLHLDADVSVRADACTTLIHSPTAALLHEPFHGFRSNKPDQLDQVDDAPRAESCTTLPHSPTAALLQEPFKSFGSGLKDSTREEKLELSRGDAGSDFDEEEVADDVSEDEEAESQHEELTEGSPTYDDRRQLGSAVTATVNSSAHAIAHTEEHQASENVALRDGTQYEEDEDHQRDNGEFDGRGAEEHDLIDSSDEEEAGDLGADDEERGATSRPAAHVDGEEELEREDEEDELSQSQDPTVPETTGGVSVHPAHDRAEHDESRFDEQEDDEEPLSDEERRLEEFDDEEEADERSRPESEAHSGFNSPGEKAESEFSNDENASLNESARADEMAPPSSQGDDDDAAEDSQALSAVGSSSSNAEHDAPPSLRVDRVESAASNVESQRDEESDDEIDRSMDSPDREIGKPSTWSRKEASILATAATAVTVSAVSTVAFSRLAALRKGSDEEEADVAQLSAGVGGRSANEEDEDDEFNQIDDEVESEQDEARRSDDEFDRNDDRRGSVDSSDATASSILSRQDTTAPVVESNPTVRSDDNVLQSRAEPTGLGIDETSSSPPSPGTAALRKDSKKHEDFTASLSSASAARRQVEEDDERDELVEDRDDEASVGEIDDHELDEGSDFDEIDNSQDLGENHLTESQQSTSTAAPVAGDAGLPSSRLAALRKDSGDDEDEFRSAQLSLSSQRRDSGDEFGDDDDEFDQSGDGGAAPRKASEASEASAHSENEANDADGSQDFGHGKPASPMESASNISSSVSAATIPSLPLAALRKNSEDDDEFRAAEVAMNSRRRDAGDGHDHSDFDDEEVVESDAKGSELDEDHEEESDVGDIDGSQDFGDDVGLPSFESPVRTAPSSSSFGEREAVPGVSTQGTASTVHEHQEEEEESRSTLRDERELIESGHAGDLEDSHHSLVDGESASHDNDANSDFRRTRDDHDASREFDGSEADELDGSQELSEVNDLDGSIDASGAQHEGDSVAKTSDARGHHDGDDALSLHAEDNLASEHARRESHGLDQSASFDDADFDRRATNDFEHQDHSSAHLQAGGSSQRQGGPSKRHDDGFDRDGGEDARASHQFEGIDVDELDESLQLDGSRAEDDKLDASREEMETQKHEAETRHNGATRDNDDESAGGVNHVDGELEDDEDDGRGDHEFDQSASFDDADFDHNMKSGDCGREAMLPSQQAARYELGSHEEVEGEEDDDSRDPRLRRAPVDDLMDDSMDEVERLLLQHAEQADIEVDSGRHFTSSLRMEDEDDDQDGDELIDSDEEEEEEEIGADSMRSDTGSEAAASPLTTQQPNGFSGKRDAGEDEDEEDDRDMDEMERLLEGVSTTSAKAQERKTSEESSDEEEEVASSSSAAVERPITTAQPSRLAKKTFSDSDDDDEEEVAAAPSPVHLPSSQLLPLSGLGVRNRGAGGGSGTLLKALSASRSAGGGLDELDDDMDEVERMMATQSLAQRKPLATPIPAPVVSSSLQSSKVDNDFDASDEEDDEIDRSTGTSPVSSAANRSAMPDRSPSTHQHETSIDAKPTGVGSHDDDEDAEEEGSGAEDELDESLAEESGTFGLSFGDADLDQMLASPMTKSTTLPTPSAPVPAVSKPAIDDSESDEDDKPSSAQSARGSSLPTPSSLLSGPGRQLGSLRPLPALGKKALPGLSALGRTTRMALDEDDDMDEVERLLLQQTSMKTTPAKLPTATLTTTTANKAKAQFDEEEDDEFNAAPVQNSPLRRPDLPMAHADDDEFAHFDRDDEDEKRDDGHSKRAAREGSNLSDSQGSASSPSRIPILRGSTLLKNPLATSPVARPRMASARSEDDYLEDSFDMEESLEEEVEEEDV